jgi:hypothetical protein
LPRLREADKAEKSRSRVQSKWVIDGRDRVAGGSREAGGESAHAAVRGGRGSDQTDDGTSRHATGG